jgi:hypothetical protein
MKTRLLLIAVFAVLIYPLTAISQQRPQISFEDLMINAESDYRHIFEAREAALNQEIPFSIYLEEGIFIEAKAVENGKLVYAVIRNLLHPQENNDVMFYNEILTSFNLDDARLSYSNGLIVNPDLGFPSGSTIENRNANYLLVVESSNNRVMLLDFNSGDLIDAEFIPTQNNFILPKHAMQSPHTTITVSDQSADVVFAYDTTGLLIGTFAPSIGPHAGILDNIRGHDYNPVNNHLFVCNAQGGNFNRVVEFDPAGNYIAQFFPDNSGGLLGPFDIIFRTNDVLVTGSTSSAAHRYDHNGNYLDDFANNILFPQQIVEFPNGHIGIASFGTSGGLKIYDQTGALANEFNSVSGLRGVHYLGSGNIIVTNSAGVHELNGTTGDFIRTIISGVSAQYVSSCDFSLDFTPVELVSFNVSVVNNSVSLSWVTSSELNNSGFEVQRKVNSLPAGEAGLQSSVSNSEFEKIGFVEGNGTTTETNHYSFEDRNLTSGKYFYRLKQIDLDGTFEYSNEVQVEVHGVTEYSLSQNYPNPFNPTTKIKYTIPFAGTSLMKFVQLKVFDVLGNEVATLVNELKPAGVYEVTFNASELGSGVYIYKLQAGDYISAGKMLLTK